ncbi:MAG: hypothetical protein Q8L35_03605 [Actinomycetota bacterium]|nr:hypothetical protein [Actinomycetota bacterium]
MINRFGFPVKDYYVQAAATAPAENGNLAIIILLNAVTMMQKFLMERLSVPRRVSTYGRRQKPNYVTG